MIAKDQMMGVLLEVCPSFRPVWDAWLSEWAESADELPLYLALAEYARHLVGMLERAETASLPAVFQAVERLLEEGDSYVYGAAAVGLLEDLQNLNLHASTEPGQFRPYLGPKSAVAWGELYDLWGAVAEAKAAGALGTSATVNPATIKSPELRRLVEQLYRKL